MILRDDHEDDWTEAADSTLERRVYYCQNWRADVVALLAENGRVIERAWYEPYGTPHGMSPADFSGTSDDTNDHYLVPDGDADADDSFVYLDLFGISASLSDMTGSSDPGDGEYGRPNGTVDGDDFFYYLDRASDAAALGRNVLSAGHDGATASHGAGSLRNRRGLAGYEWDPHVRRYHVRNRVLYPETGRWTRRDPLGYVDGGMLLQYGKGMTMSVNDPLGLFGVVCDSIGGCAPTGYPGMVNGTCASGPVYSVYALAHSSHGYIQATSTTAVVELAIIQHGVVLKGGWDFHVHGNWCGPKYGGNFTTDCNSDGVYESHTQTCPYPNSWGGCPILSCSDAACKWHDECMYYSCIDWRFGPPFSEPKSRCHKICDCSFCNILKLCKNQRIPLCELIANWAMRQLFCPNNENAENCDNDYSSCEPPSLPWPRPAPEPGDGGHIGVD